MYDFLKHLQQTKTDELNRIQHELQVVNDNCKKVEENLAQLKVDVLLYLNVYVIDVIFEYMSFACDNQDQAGTAQGRLVVVVVIVINSAASTTSRRERGGTSI